MLFSCGSIRSSCNLQIVLSVWLNLPPFSHSAKCLVWIFIRGNGVKALLANYLWESREPQADGANQHLRNAEHNSHQTPPTRTIGIHFEGKSPRTMGYVTWFWLNPAGAGASRSFLKLEFPHRAEITVKLKASCQRLSMCTGLIPVAFSATAESEELMWPRRSLLFKSSSVIAYRSYSPSVLLLTTGDPKKTPQPTSCLYLHDETNLPNQDPTARPWTETVSMLTIPAIQGSQ